MSGVKRSALVLSGGGALGAAHVGAISVLEQRGYKFDYFAGVSAGAIVTALLACGKTSAEVKRILDELSFFSLAFDFNKTQFALLRGDKVKKLIDKILGDIKFSDLPVQLVIGATDFSNGQRVIVREGRIADAVRASISVPVLFEPYYHPLLKRWLVDGGLTQNFPLDLAVKEYLGSKIFAIDVATSFPVDFDFSKRNHRSRTKTLLETFQRTLHIMLLNQQAAFVDDARVLRIIPNLHEFAATDVFRLAEIYERGKIAAEKMDLLS